MVVNIARMRLVGRVYRGIEHPPVLTAEIFPPAYFQVGDATHRQLW